MRVFHSILSVNTGILFLSFIINVFGKNSCYFDVKVKQMLLNEGFHRNITYGIVFNPKDEENKLLYKDCIVALEQTLPPGVFANSDELEEQRRNLKLHVIPKNKVNTELPTEESESSSVYIMGKIKQNNAYMWLPVHARYHRAVPGGGDARNEIEPPKLYLRCPDQRLDLCGKSVPHQVTFLCNGSSREKCSWKELSYTILTDTLIWDVPVGNLDHYYVVAICTTIVVVAGSVYLLQAAHEFQAKHRRYAPG